MRFLDLLSSGSVVYSDGGLGTMLQAAGMPVGQNPALMSLTHPEVLQGIHAAYFAAGSHLVCANTFSASAPKLEGSGRTVEEVVTAAVGCARRAADPRNGLVALDLGPLGELIEPLGGLPFERAVELFAQQVRAGAAAGVDLIAIETMMDLYETKAALLAAKECCDLPVMVTMTFEENGRTFTGCPVASMALTLEGLGADVIGVNCSLGPAQLAGIVSEIARWTRLPIAAKPNAGLPRPDGSYDLDAAGFAEEMKQLIARGATVAGGCCGTTPATIAALVAATRGLTPPRRESSPPSAVCSATGYLTFDRPRPVGERLNPTGKKLLRQALLDGDMAYILRQAAAQEADGAAILDVNVGAPGVDEAAVMPRVVKAVQSVSSLPLQIDSADPAAIEAGLRVCNGRAIVNSVNGKDEVLDVLLPVVRKYGAMVVGLTLDERGIPETAGERVSIAEKIVARAAEYGIPREDVIIDCLTLTVGSGDRNAAVALEAVRRVTALGLKTALGVSNVSFGLPRRDLVNRAFLTLALQAGLTLPILNPGDRAMLDALDAFLLLSGQDEAGVSFIARHGQEQGDPAPAPAANQSGGDLSSAILSGLEQPAAALARSLLQTLPAEALINERLIPILDEVGGRYERGEIFLPQLIRAAEAARAAFDVVRAALAARGEADGDRGTVVLATVQGDIHDIGKNIVRAVLENYGYRIIDLGRDVPPERVVEAAGSSGAGLVGLSALMTTTLPAMASTVSLLLERCPDCRVVVGGAVLTDDYARDIGAHFYARDASATVSAAREVFGR